MSEDLTPKEKAKELIFKFRSLGLITGSKFSKWDEAKQCALICVDEIIKENHFLDKDAIIKFDSLCKLVERIEYWDKVKKEIEKL